MLIFKYYKKYKKFSKFIVIIFLIINFLMMTSCTVKNFKDNDTIIFTDTKNQFKKLIIPKGMNIPDQNKEYDIPYTKKDLEIENYNIFPPI